MLSLCHLLFLRHSHTLSLLRSLSLSLSLSQHPEHPLFTLGISHFSFANGANESAFLSHLFLFPLSSTFSDLHSWLVITNKEK